MRKEINEQLSQNMFYRDLVEKRKERDGD